jgi:hypothetical protein
LILLDFILRAPPIEAVPQDGKVLGTTNPAFSPVYRKVKPVPQIEMDFIAYPAGFAFFPAVDTKIICIADVLYASSLQFLIRCPAEYSRVTDSEGLPGASPFAV